MCGRVTENNNVRGRAGNPFSAAETWKTESGAQLSQDKEVKLSTMVQKR